MHKQGYNDNGELIRDFYVEHDPVELYCDPAEGMTQQEFAEECDINFMMARYEQTGVFTNLATGEPAFLDVSNVPDLATAVAYLDEAERAFMVLPAVVRKEFDNNAVRFVEYASDPANLPRMREWGLAAPQEPAPAVSPAPATPVAAAPQGAAQ